MMVRRIMNDEPRDGFRRLKQQRHDDDESAIPPHAARPNWIWIKSVLIWGLFY